MAKFCKFCGTNNENTPCNCAANAQQMQFNPQAMPGMLLPQGMQPMMQPMMGQMQQMQQGIQQPMPGYPQPIPMPIPGQPQPNIPIQVQSTSPAKAQESNKVDEVANPNQPQQPALPGPAPHIQQTMQPGQAPHMQQTMQPGHAPHMQQTMQPGHAPHMQQTMQPGHAPHMQQTMQPGYAPHMQQTMQPGQAVSITFDSDKANAMILDARETASSGYASAKEIIKDMIPNIQKDPTRENTKERFAIGIGHLLVVILLSFVVSSTIISTLLGGYGSNISIPLSIKILIAVIFVLMASTYIALPALIAYNISKKTVPDQTFRQVLGVFSICTIPTTALYVIATIVFLIDIKLFMYVMVVALIIYTVHANEAIIATTRQNRNTAVITLIIVLTLTAFAQYGLMQMGTEMVIDELQDLFMNPSLPSIYDMFYY